MSSVPVLKNSSEPAAEDDVASFPTSDPLDALDAPDADALLMEERLSHMESMYTTNEWVVSDAFADMTTPELNTIMLTSLMSMLERGAISSSASHIAAFNAMSETIHSQVCPADTVFNTFSTTAPQDE